MSEKYAHYHVLLPNQLAGLEMVLGLLEDVSTRFIMNKKTPVLFLDGIDILAKDEKEEKLCGALITMAKILANNKKLRVVFISSEGTVMPLLEKLSATNRGVICQVVDINDDDAVRYLTRNDVHESLAKELVNRIGGRMVHLESCVYLLKRMGYNDKGFEEIYEGISTFYSRGM